MSILSARRGTELSVRPLGADVFHTGDVIRKWMDDRQWGYVETAAAASVTKNTITDVIAGKNATVKTLTKVVEGLGHTMLELYAALDASGRITDDEVQLFTAYRRLSERHRAWLLNSAEYFAAGPREPATDE